VIFRDVFARSFYDEAIHLFCLPRQIDFLFDWGHPLRHPVEERDPSIPSTEGNPVAIHPFPTKQKSPKHLLIFEASWNETLAFCANQPNEKAKNGV
jgi:hypothetical protein